MRTYSICLPIMVLFACLAGCGGDPLRVTSLQLGRGLNADQTVTGHTTRFGPDDTVYVSVITAGIGKGTIGVRWTYEGRVMGEPVRPVSYTNVAATEFHLQSATGFPPGNYSVEAFLNGQSAGTREFRVDLDR